MSSKPIVGISTNETINFNGRQVSHSVGKRYVNSVMNFSGVLPVLIPPCINKDDLEFLLDKMHGIVLTGGRANVEPHHYNGPKFPKDEPVDPDRDRIVLDIIPKCVERKMPIFGICRGIQEINISYGGTLFYRVHQENGKKDHRMPTNDDATIEEIFRPKHQIEFSKNSILRELVNEERFMVNSLHGQGIQRLGKDLNVEACSEDGLIEAISIKNYSSFGIGVQWHAEFHPEREENYLNKKLLESFGEACLEYSLS